MTETRSSQLITSTRADHFAALNSLPGEKNTAHFVSDEAAGKVNLCVSCSHTLTQTQTLCKLQSEQQEMAGGIYSIIVFILK